MEIDKKNLAAGVSEMRSVAKRLMAWADDLEKSLAKGCAADGAADASAAAAPVVSAVPAVAPAPTLAEVKAYLTGKCAAGYSAQVKALIASYGVFSLSEVPSAALGALMEAAALIGEDDASGGDSDAG